MITLTSEEAASAVLSIRLMSDGLTFALQGTRTERGFIPFSEEAGGGILDKVQEIFFQYEWLCLPYRRVMVYYTPDSCVLCPSELFEMDSQTIWFHSVVTPNPEYGVQTYQMGTGDRQILCPIDTALLRFLHRTHLAIECQPYFLPLLETQVQQTRVSSNHRLLICLLDTRCHIFYVRAGEVVYANVFAYSFSSEEAVLGELVYYTTALWKQFALSAETDALYIMSNADVTSPLQGRMQSVIDEYVEICSNWVSTIEVIPYSPIPAIQ